jgi:hypothetical protein
MIRQVKMASARVVFQIFISKSQLKREQLNFLHKSAEQHLNQ